MNAKNAVIVALTASLDAITSACAADAGSAAAVTLAVCEALMLKATIEEVVLAATTGYNLMGVDLPAGFASNVKRLNAAGLDYIVKAKDTGLALNNRLMLAIDAPKISSKGAKTKTKTKTKTTAAAAATTEMVSLMDVLMRVRDIRNTVLPKVTSDQGILEDCDHFLATMAAKVGVKL